MESVTAGWVKTRADFLQFLDELIAEYYARGDEWENPTLPRYLEAMRGWTDDASLSRGDWDKEFTKPTWNLFAQILLPATEYE